MTDSKGQVSARYKEFARAVIESALEDDHRDFFLDPDYDYIFTLWVMAAGLDKKTLQDYVRHTGLNNKQIRKIPKMRSNIKPIRVVIGENDMGIYECQQDAANILGLSLRSIRRAYKHAYKSADGSGMFSSQKYGKVYITPIPKDDI